MKTLEAYSRTKTIPVIVNIIYWFGLLVVLLQLLLKKFFTDVTFVESIDEFVFVVYAIICVRYMSTLLAIKYYKISLIFYLLFIFMGGISFLLYSPKESLNQVLLQILLDLKTPVFISASLICAGNYAMQKKVELFFKLLLLINLPFCILQLLSPGTYNAMFPSYSSQAMFSSGDTTLPRVAGIFWHPGVTAFFTSLTSFYYIYINKNRLFAGISLLTLLLTLQRQEIVTFIMLLVFAFWFYSENKKLKFYALSFVATVTCVVIVSFGYLLEYFQYINNSMQLNDLKYSSDARTVFYYNSVKLASANFPFGVGFGNFGGFSAKYFDSNLYHVLGFDDFWWYRSGRKFLTDTFYPHIVGESGYIGTMFYILFLFAVYKMFMNYVRFKNLKGAVSFILLYLYLDCLTSPVLNDGYSLILVGFLMMLLKFKDNQIVILEVV